MLPVVTLEQARGDSSWALGELVVTRFGTLHAIVRGTGPDVLLLHGVTDNAHTWQSLQQDLARVARTHALDLPGHGLSDVPRACLGPQEMADWVAGYMEAARVERAVVVGWSLGGAVSLALAAWHAARVSAIVLEGPAALDFPFPTLLWPLRVYGIAELMPWVGSRDFTRRAAMEGTFARGFRPSEEVMRRYFRAWCVRERARYIRELLQTLQIGETNRYVERVRAPAWVVHGEQDRLVPVRIAHELGRRLARANVRTLPQIGHAPHIEEPQAILSAISSAIAAA